MVGKLNVVKEPLETPMDDKPVRFAPFVQNLHLELLEVKEKLIPGLPPVILTRKPQSLTQPPQPAPQASAQAPQPKPSAPAPVVPKKSIVIPTELSASEEEDFSDSDTEESSIEIPDSPKPKKTKPAAQKPTDSTSYDDSDSEESSGMEELREKKQEPQPKDKDPLPSTSPNIPPQYDQKDADAEAYDNLTPEERETQEKEELLIKFKILKKKYRTQPNVDIPTFNEHSDLKSMKTTYKRTIQELLLDECVERNKTYLKCALFMIETLCVNMLGLTDMEGFTRSQIGSMYQYEKLLIELGEQSYDRWNLNIPISLQLIGAVLLQGFMFWMYKYVEKNNGHEQAETFRTFMGNAPVDTQKPQQSNTPPPGGQPPGGQQPPPAQPQRRKMEGPSIRASDLKQR